MEIILHIYSQKLKIELREPAWIGNFHLQSVPFSFAVFFPLPRLLAALVNLLS
jgi:hypothetical protein